jgi:putative DNA primase/helicase
MTLDVLLARLKRVRRSGNGYVALCPAHDDRHHSLSITQSNDRILLHCFADCTVEMICEAFGIGVKDLFHAAGRANANWTDDQRREYARRIWERSKPAGRTVVETYLRNRGIGDAPIPQSIRLTDSVTHVDYGWPFPALTAGLQNVGGQFAGVSLTLLCADGSDKAPVGLGEERVMYGPIRGAAVRLSAPGELLAIGEGIETMLSVQQSAGIPCWAALTATNLVHVRLPDSVGEVIVCADADATGLRAAQEAARRLIGEGRRVRIARPGFGKDFNEMTL